MTSDVRDPQLTDRPEQPSASDLSLGEGARAIFRFFHSKKTGLFLILAMGFFTLLGVLFEQVPDDVAANPTLFNQWLEQMRPRYGGWTAPLNAMGVFQMFSSVWFLATTALLAVSIAACTAHRIPLLWKDAQHPHLHVTDGFFTHARVHDSIATEATPGASTEQLKFWFAKNRFRVTESDVNESGEDLYADRFRWAPFGTVVAHLAFIIILLGVLVTSSLGWRLDDFSVGVGTKVPVGHGTGLTVEANSFTDSYHADGRPKDYASGITLYDNGKQVAKHTIRVNSPLTYDGVKFNQASFGVASQMRVFTTSNETVYDASVPLEYTTQDQSQVYGKFEAAGLEVYVITPASGQTDPEIGAGQVKVEVYRSGNNTPNASQVLTQGRAASINNLGFMFVRERQYTGLMVSRDPGAPVVWLGAGLLILGMCVTMFCRHHRIWMRIKRFDDGLTHIQLASPDKRDPAFEARFADLVATLGPPARSDAHQPASSQAQPALTEKGRSDA